MFLIPTPYTVEFTDISQLDPTWKQALGILDAHVDAYWIEADSDLQEWLDTQPMDDLDALVNARLDPVLARIHDAANAWRTVR